MRTYARNALFILLAAAFLWYLLYKTFANLGGGGSLSSAAKLVGSVDISPSMSVAELREKLGGLPVEISGRPGFNTCTVSFGGLVTVEVINLTSDGKCGWWIEHGRTCSMRVANEFPGTIGGKPLSSLQSPPPPYTDPPFPNYSVTPLGKYGITFDDKACYVKTQ
jgi:hypothetical protein